MSIPSEILDILCSGYSVSYKKLRKKVLGNTYPTNRNPVRSNALYLTMARLKNNGLVTKNGDLIKITKKGKEWHTKKKESILPNHSSKTDTKKDYIKNIIIAFDIPESYRRKRDWLRIELTILGFSPIQKSVWFGSAPLPQNFIKDLNDLKMLQYLKFFKAQEQDII